LSLTPVGGGVEEAGKGCTRNEKVVVNVEGDRQRRMPRGSQLAFAELSRWWNENDDDDDDW